MKSNNNTGILSAPIRALIKFRIRDSFIGAASFMAVITTVLIILLIATSGADPKLGGKGVFAGYTVAAAITLFVFGICTIRDDLRLGIQNGLSRKSVFLAEVLSTAAVSAFVALYGEIYTTLGSALCNPEIMAVVDIYQMLFLPENAAMSFLAHLQSIASGFLLMLFCYFLGAFFSLMFYRLNKLWTIIVAVSIPIMVSNVLPMLYLLLYTMTPFKAFFDGMVRDPNIFCIGLLIFSAIIVGIDYLLIRRASIRSAIA